MVDGEMRIVAEKLQDRFGEENAAEIDATVEAEARRFDPARFRTFVPLLVERAAKARLRRRHRA